MGNDAEVRIAGLQIGEDFPAVIWAPIVDHDNLVVVGQLAQRHVSHHDHRGDGTAVVIGGKERRDARCHSTLLTRGDAPRSVPPAGFEPAISALKGLRPGPLDDGGRTTATIQRERTEAQCQFSTQHSVLHVRPGSGSWIRTNDLRVMRPTSYRCSIPRRDRVFTGSALDATRSGPAAGGDRGTITSGAEGRPEQILVLALVYFPRELPLKYRRRSGVSLPCSGRERVGPPRSKHQDQFTGRYLAGRSRPSRRPAPRKRGAESAEADRERSCWRGKARRVPMSPRPLVPLRYSGCPPSTCGLSNWSSSSGLTRLSAVGNLILA